jgi:hypothetical protein
MSLAAYSYLRAGWRYQREPTVRNWQVKEHFVRRREIGASEGVGITSGMTFSFSIRLITRANSLEQFLRRFVGGVLGDEFAGEGAGEERGRERVHQPLRHRPPRRDAVTVSAICA